MEGVTLRDLPKDVIIEHIMPYIEQPLKDEIKRLKEEISILKKELYKHREKWSCDAIGCCHVWKVQCSVCDHFLCYDHAEYMHDKDFCEMCFNNYSKQ